MRKLLLALAATLAFSPGAWAATYHVKSGSACSNHGTVLGGSCSTNTSTCGAEATPCCTLPQAVTRANGSAGADTIYLHQHTETATGSGVYYTTITETVTIRPQDSDTFSLNLSSSWQVAFLVNVSEVTIGGATGTIDLTGSLDSGNNTDRRGYIQNTTSTVQGLYVRRVNFHGTGNAGNNIANYQAIHFSGTGLRVEECLFDGWFDFTISWAYNGSAGGDRGGIIRDNDFLFNSTGITVADSERPIAVFLEHIGTLNSPDSIAIYNNLIDYSGIGANATGIIQMALYWRPSAYKTYAFNNRVRYRKTSYNRINFVLFQDHEPLKDVAGEWVSERYFVFNNTIDNPCQANSCRMIDWEDCVGPTSANGIIVRNNIAMYGERLAGLTSGCYSGYPANTSAPRDTRSVLSHNLCWMPSNPDATTPCMILESGGDITRNNNLETITDPRLTQGSDPATILKLSSPLSNAIGFATNDPLGQGAGVCSITADGVVINCALDFEGDARGTTWDAGADEYNCPSTITDLRCIATDLTSARLGWTAPCDTDGVASYDVRYGQAYIVDDTTWVGDEQATGEPTPGPQGTAEQMNITLPAGYYYTFHMTYTDGLSNVSARSNVTAKCIVGLDGSQPPNPPSIHELQRSTTSGYPEIEPPSP